MKITTIKEKAKEVGVKPGKIKKIDLIHAIQNAEGNTPCFSSVGAKECEEENCLWKEDCKM